MKTLIAALSATLILFFSVPSFAQKKTDPKIPVWVQAAGAADGFTSVDKGLRDSAKDVENRVKSSKTLSLAPTKQDALVIVEIVNRDTETVQITGWRTIGNNKKDNWEVKTTLVVRVIAGEFEGEFKASGNANSVIAWREAARKVVKDMEVWAKENHSQLTK